MTSRRVDRAIAGAACGLVSATLFGISAPVSKLLLPHVDPWVLAGLLYVGAGLGLQAVRMAQRLMGSTLPAGRERLQRQDLPCCSRSR